MLFNSYAFIFAFLPLTFFIYFYLNKKRLTELSKVWLVLSSLFFYSWWNIIYLPLIIVSILINYFLGNLLSQQKRYKKLILSIGIVINVALLGYFKYSDFFIENINAISGANIPLLHLALPLAISFFTFQQIAYLVDSYRGETMEYNFLNYILFVTFFPQLIAGPIVHHKEMMPQFSKSRNKVINYQNIAMGIFIFSIGLFKKVIIADSFAIWATQGFDVASSLNFIEAWATSLSYTFQLYFDFSGYTDMAIGIALLFNIKLPINFFSPYKAVNIQDFWRRWHITLSRFLRDYIYIPLGGNRISNFRTYFNLMVTFLIAGIWHGAGWTFIFWGFLHGVALIVHRLWRELGIKLYSWVAWFLTFNFVNISWVFFRAKEWEDAKKVLWGMFGQSGFMLPTSWASQLNFLRDYGVEFGDYLADIHGSEKTIIKLFIILLVTLFTKNSIEQLNNFKLTYRTLFIAFITFFISIVAFNKVSEFLYFNF